MKRVVSVSLGASSGNLSREAEFLGERFLIEREGTDGDSWRAAARIAALDGNVDAIGLGGTDLYLFAGTRRYTVREAAWLASHARRSPVVDGSGLKQTLERDTVGWLQREGILDFRGRRVLVMPAVDRVGMAESLVAAGADVRFGDIVYGLGLPLLIRNIGTLRLLARVVLPVLSLVPLRLVYPLGKEQERRVVRAPQHYHWAEVIAGDGHFIRRYLPDRMNGQTLILQTLRKHQREEMQRCGVGRVVLTTPEFDGESFATNVMEGVLVTLLRARNLPPTPENYRILLRELDWKPSVIDLQQKEGRTL